jgi:hypothetical protein
MFAALLALTSPSTPRSLFEHAQLLPDLLLYRRSLLLLSAADIWPEVLSNLSSF